MADTASTPSWMDQPSTAFHQGSGPAWASGAPLEKIGEDIGAIQEGIDKRRQQPRQSGTPAPDDGSAA